MFLLSDLVISRNSKLSQMLDVILKERLLFSIFAKRVRVQAVNAMGAGAFSGLLHFATLPSVPGAPQIACLSSNASGIKLQWSMTDEALHQSQAADRTLSGKHTPRESHTSSKLNPVKFVLQMSRKPETK